MWNPTDDGMNELLLTISRNKNYEDEIYKKHNFYVIYINCIIIKLIEGNKWKEIQE